VEKISEISTACIARYELSNSHKSFLGPYKKMGSYFTSSHLYAKMSKLVVLLWIHYLRQVGYMLGKF